MVRAEEATLPEEGGREPPTEDQMEEVNLGSSKSLHPILISKSLSKKEKGAYTELINEFKDVFAWSCEEMLGLDPSVVVHHLNIQEDMGAPVEIMVDNSCGFERMTFLDGFSEYNQIRMDPSNERHTSFRTPLGVYCYIVMLFGLKNKAATYQRAMMKIFKALQHKTVES